MAGIKEYSDWPTIPQLYVRNEFVGGCDILMSMHQNGELAKLFEEKDVLVAAEGNANPSEQERPAAEATAAETTAEEETLAEKRTPGNVEEITLSWMPRPRSISLFCIAYKGMAKVKHTTGHDSKPARHVVSTSQIFKKAKKPASPKSRQTREKTSLKKPSDVGKGRSKAKRQVASEDPDYKAFNEAIEASRGFIQTTNAESVDAVRNDLSQRLAKINEDFSNQLKADSATDQAIFQPLGNVEIQYNRKDGSLVGSAPLSARIKLYKNVIATEERELESLFHQYTHVNEEIIADAEEALGTKWTDILNASTVGENQAIFGNDRAELAAALKEVQDRFVDLADKAGQHHLDKMKASEKEFEVHRKKRTGEILSLLDEGS
ncbi:MAG: hypothetical protein Q9191_004165 [Dirinaria sp. TL-2023a]